MTFEIGLLIAVVGLAILLFSFEWFSADVVALGILITLVLTQLVPAKQAFLGFGSDTVVMTTGLLVLTAALFFLPSLVGGDFQDLAMVYGTYGSAYLLLTAGILGVLALGRRSSAKTP